MDGGGGQGHSLGGGTGRPGGSSSRLTPEEMRRRRLAALGGGGAPPAPPPRNPVRTPPVGGGGGDGVDDDDAELRAALAMSMRPDDDDEEERGGETAAAKECSSRDDDAGGNGASLTSAAVTRSEIRSFHSIMWDDSVTTSNDKERWLGQGVSTPSLLSELDDSAGRPRGEMDGVVVEDAKASSTEVGGGPGERHDALASLTEARHGDDGECPHRRWGLTQVHGGPCGVLAAVQAEMIRLLLFGRRTGGAASKKEDDDGGGGFELSYPPPLPNGDGDGDERSDDDDGGNGGAAADAVTNRSVRTALAMALGTVLARAALAPPASASASADGNDGVVGGGGGKFDDDDDVPSPDGRARVILPALVASVVVPGDPTRGGGDGGGAPAADCTTAEDGDVVMSEPPSSARAPDGGPYEGLKWDDLAPWWSSSSSPWSSSSDVPPRRDDPTADNERTVLRTYAIELDSMPPPSDEEEPEPSSGGGGGGNFGSGEASGWIHVGKRQKLKTVQDVGGSGNGVNGDDVGRQVRNMSPSTRDRATIRLAYAVSRFLLRGSPNVDDENDDNAADASINPASPSPLDYFHRPGGVLLLAMSLVATRTSAVIRSEMDDPSGTRLTSQFGHCGQELLNLLLTGQAVSNVFDNVLTVSGALTCRGVQRRPNVGYLSQLESLRYCEVGGYYKSPNFPVWVVGSTSHFTVLFGDGRCLRESKSDALLERCRRAFKAVEGGEENGFIDAPSLERAIRDLDLFGKVGGMIGVSSLAAHLEVHGAGIILWDDFWKATSRLLTGASLQSVLQGRDGGGGSGGGGGNAGGTAPMSSSSSSRQTDENMPPLMITEHGEMGSSAARFGGGGAAAATTAASGVHGGGGGGGHMTDEELAKKLAAEWATDAPAPAPALGSAGGGGVGRSSRGAAATATTTTPASSSRPKTDEELARELQAQWDAEVATGLAGTGGSGGTTRGDAIVVDDGAAGGGRAAAGGPRSASGATSRETKDDGGAGESKGDDGGGGDERKPAATADAPGGAAAAGRKYDFEKFGDTFPLYHYNGLRGGTLTAFRVTRLSPEEAVGASIALSSGGAGGNGGGKSGAVGGAAAGGAGLGGRGGSHSGDLEDVVRTKWPSCMFNWGGVHPPFID